MRRLTALALAGLLAGAAFAHAATITIVNVDGAGEGFNDPTAAAPVGGNPGTTVGQQRLNVFQAAANIWGGILPDNITVVVNAKFDPLSCTATSGVLGSAGATEVFRDFPNAPFAGTWYHPALANRLSNLDNDPATADITATFNSSPGTATCLPMGWYYGLDGNEGSQIELLPVVLHELGHGLGFSTFTSGQNGAILGGFPAVWDHFLYDEGTGLHWIDDSAAQRVASALNCTNLSWDGPAVRLAAPSFLAANKPTLRQTSPATVEYAIGAAQFGPALSNVPVSGQVVLVQDSFGNPTNACESIVNDLTGKIAFLDRGTCGFTVKVKNAQLAGAIGVIVADSVAGCPPAAMGGIDATITIPSVRISLADGNTLRAALPGGVTATLVADPVHLQGTDANGRVLMYTPNPYQSGSSVSHWDTSAEPSLLMEPAITTGLSSNVDLTKQLFVDIGWFVGAAAVAPGTSRNALEACVPNPVHSNALLAYSLSGDARVDLRVYDVVGRQVAQLASGNQGAGRHTVIWNVSDAAGRRLPPGMYRYRLRAGGWSDTHSLVVVR